MNDPGWRAWLREAGGLVLADGAMGTMLFDAGLHFGDAPERWNLDQPQQVRAVHAGYLSAGARILLTNTFGGNRFRLALHGLQNRVAELNRAAVDILRSALNASGRLALVAGDIGPSGSILAPLGDLDYAEAVAGFAEQAQALTTAGVDLIWIETMSDLEEVRAALEGVRRVAPEIAVVATMSFDTHGRTMMGITPEQAVRALPAWGASAVGGNCGNGPEEILQIVRKMHTASPETVLVAKSNAGIPELVGGRACYRATPQDMAQYLVRAVEAGATVVGGCCGSTPAHVHAMADALAQLVPRARRPDTTRGWVTHHDPDPPRSSPPWPTSRLPHLAEEIEAELQSLRIASDTHPVSADGPRHRTALIVCGALAREVLALRDRHGWPADVLGLPALLHNRPERIPEAVLARIRQARRSYERVLVVYGDCGTGGALDRLLEQERVERLAGPHCYEFYADHEFHAMMAEAPGTFFLTDYMVRSFDHLVVQGLGLDRHPELRDEYFGNYSRVVYLAQQADPALHARAEQAAQRLGLPLATRHVGYGALERRLREWFER